MPEGDSIAGNAAMLRPILVGEVVESVHATSGSVRANSGRIQGRTVTGIRTRGKNLVVDFDSGYSLWVHLGMNGRWRLLSRKSRVPGPAKVALTTRAIHAVCLGAPKAEVGRTPAIDLALEGLGPDLLAEEVDYEEILRRIRALPEGTTLGRTLLDQTVAAGIGNVYKSELAFLAGLLPSTPVETLTDEQLLGIYGQARSLLLANIGSGARSTTGDRGRGRTTWVYNGGGLRCRRCSTQIFSGRLDGRVTFWCPSCQRSA
ncbi:endonuclease VIII Nei2 [soil metagenome]